MLVLVLPWVDVFLKFTACALNKFFQLSCQLNVARGSLHDVFFTIPVKVRMSYIAHSRGVARAKQAKRVTRVSDFDLQCAVN